MIQEFTLDANGIVFHGIEAGEGPLVLCLHGFPDHAKSFGPLIDCLAAAGYHAVAPNMRGFWPTSPAPDGCYQPWATGADAVTIVDALGADRAYLIGHDWGAAAAYAAVRTAPNRFDKLVAMSLPFGASMGRALLTDPEQQRRSWYIFFFQLALADAAIGVADFALIDRLWRDWSPGYELPADRREALKQMFRQPGVATDLLAYYRQAFTPSASKPEWTAANASLNVTVATPTLYLHGRNDGCIGADVADGMGTSFTGGFTLKVVEDAGHFLQLEQPDIVAYEVISFFQD